MTAAAQRPTYDQTTAILKTAARLTTERRKYWQFREPHPGDVKGIIRDTAACHGVTTEAVAAIVGDIRAV